MSDPNETASAGGIPTPDWTGVERGFAALVRALDTDPLIRAVFGPLVDIGQPPTPTGSLFDAMRAVHHEATSRDDAGLAVTLELPRLLSWQGAVTLRTRGPGPGAPSDAMSRFRSEAVVETFDAVFVAALRAAEAVRAGRGEPVPNGDAGSFSDDWMRATR